MVINGSGDNLWHLSLAAEVKKQIPPTFPVMSGIPLKNYHYFSDAIWGVLSKLSGIPITILYFQIGSLLVCYFLSYLIFKLAKYYTKSDFWSLICVVTTLFLGSAAFLKPLIIKGSEWSGNNFMLDTPYSQLINLHTGLAYILILLGTLSTFKWINTKSIKYGYSAAFIFGLTFGFKTFFAIPVAIAFGLMCMYRIQETKFKSLLPLILLAVISIIIIFMISDRTGLGSKSAISLRPGWLLTKMIEDDDRFHLDNYYLKQLLYQSKNNWPRLTQMETEKVIIYIFGNFWIKLIGIFYLIKYIKKYKEENIFILLCITVSAILPLIITPQPDPFNAVQFGQVAVIFLGLAFGLYLSTLKNSKWRLIFVLLIPVCVYSFYKDFFGISKFNEYVVPKEEITALNYLKENTDINSIIMVDPLFDNSKMKVTALAERRTFYTGGNLPWLLGIDDSYRKGVQQKFFSDGTDKKYISNIITNNSINYIYTSSPIFSQEYPIVFSNSKVLIYKTP